ncbi:MAG: Glu/Leu/Phe/Val dehydrogenase [Candidatus Pacebacteria bacterium]|nr:Glu/Leu/Phe/Val dehydrogenase [Candidatus Paceibacterota bacterium]
MHIINSSACVACQSRLLDITQGFNLSPKEKAILEHPQRTISTTMPIMMDDGSVRVFSGLRVQYNDALGPTKGGLRYHPEVDEGEVQELAFLMMLKNSLAGLPYGGGKGGITCDPKSLSVAELERLTRAFVRALGTTVGPDTDIPAPDVNTGAQTMDWFVDEYEKMVGHPARAVVTGKSVAQGGSLGRDSATGRGGVYLLERYAQEQGWNPAATTIGIQGFGNVGGWFARLATGLGFKVVAVSGSKGGVYAPEGFTLAALEASLAEKTLPEGSPVSNEELLALPVQVLVPSALAHQIHKYNASTVQAQLVIEMANAPTTVGADEILAMKGVRVIPDILANGGGVTVSYFEWLQNRAGETWDEELINEKLQKSILDAYARVMARSVSKGSTLRSAAYHESIERILNAERARGRL